MQFKYAVSTSEKAQLSEERQAVVDKRPGLILQEWGAAFVEADPAQIGMAGSPTKVKAIENVVFTAKENLQLTDNDTEIENLVKELIANHTIG
jgi:electron transfer flavoprotein beta subunit